MPVLTIQDLTIFTDLLIFFNNTYIQTSMYELKNQIHVWKLNKITEILF